MSDLISRKEMLRTYQKLCRNISCSECSSYFCDASTGDCLLEKWIHSLPSAEPKTPSNGSTTSMNTEKMHVRTTDGLIRRQDVLHELDGCDYELKDWQRWKLKTMVRDIPSVEQEIIRCRDCKNHVLHPRIGVPWCKLLHSDMGYNQFCSYAERRGEEE